MVPRTGRARRMPPDERREALVCAALPLVLEHGPAVTTRQIAEAAAVAEGTIFRVFEDKDALVRVVAERVLDPAPLLRELAAIDRTLDLRDRVTAVVQALQRRLSGIFPLVDALGLSAPRAADDRGPRPVDEQFLVAVVDVIGADLHRLRVHPMEFAATLRLLTFSATHPRINGGAPLSADQIVAVLLDGMLADRCTHDPETHHPEKRGPRPC
ncbi:TetR/AcrR family transcriptional regulator [Goekera deserti]|nr:TetR/AcrR family transcriptional regulator [Goekera deserti]